MDLEGLNHLSISEMSRDEAIERLREMRLNRRMPVKRAVKKAATKAPKEQPIPELNKSQASRLLNSILEDMT